MGRTDASAPAVIGRYVLDPFVLSEGHCRFSWRQYRFANSYRKSLDLLSACEESGLTREQAIRFLRRPEVRQWMDDRLQMQETKRSWSAEGRWWTEGDRMFRQEAVPKHRLHIWHEFGERLEVKPSKNSEPPGTPITINISDAQVKAYQEREKTFDTTAR